MIFTSSTRFFFLGTLLTTLGSLQASAAPAPALVTVAAPFFNPISATDALPATILGVDAAGRTTYALNQDEVQDNISYKTTLAKITGTLVAAADYASYTIAADVPGLAITLGFDCSVDGKSGNAGGSLKPDTATRRLAPTKGLCTVRVN
ncbi:hypothetical protein C8R46DRAFT_1209835 [Mycena filopes]|nr:hypothetical protein C8R46DRAFT_1209835 [Mycena filopes]